jgi:hypothetical protein
MCHPQPKFVGVEQHKGRGLVFAGEEHRQRLESERSPCNEGTSPARAHACPSVEVTCYLNVKNVHESYSPHPAQPPPEWLLWLTLQVADHGDGMKKSGRRNDALSTFDIASIQILIVRAAFTLRILRAECSIRNTWISRGFIL